MNRLKVTHIITGLNDGGAESTLFRLCVHDDSMRHEIISLMDMGKYGSLLEDAGLKVFTVGMQRGKFSIVAFFRICFLLCRHRPDIVQTWLYHANFLGGIAAKVVGLSRIYWGIHHTNLSSGAVKRSTFLVAKISAILSYLIPSRIISCSVSAMTVHQRMGYRNNIFTVIPNGYNLSTFQPIPAVRNKYRRELCLESDIFLIGMVARFDIQKDHNNLFKAIKSIDVTGIDYRCLLIGTDMTTDNVPLLNMINSNGLESKVILLGPRPDIQYWMNTIDLHVLSSLGEAFPNVLSEAMACGTPCVSTDVGDAALIIGDTGWIVPAQDSVMLARAVREAMIIKTHTPTEWRSLQLAARQRIVENFSIERMALAYAAVWKE